jgi:LysM repeat protein
MNNYNTKNTNLSQRRGGIAMPNIPVPKSVTCPGGALYTIHAGDTLYGLAQRFNTTVEAIIRANPGIDPTSLQLARNICIPVAPGPGPCPGGFPYIIKSGDTFYNIARRYGIAVEALSAANPGVNPNLLGIGQQICVPAVAPPPQPCPGRLYTIEPGDTFYRIARKFGYTLDALLTANPGVNPDTIQAGQTLCLPPAPGGGPLPCPAGSIYVIQAGDTLYSIAQRRGIGLNVLLAANPQITDPGRLQIGDPVCIPG